MQPGSQSKLELAGQLFKSSALLVSFASNLIISFIWRMLSIPDPQCVKLAWNLHVWWRFVFQATFWHWAVIALTWHTFWGFQQWSRALGPNACEWSSMYVDAVSANKKQIDLKGISYPPKRQWPWVGLYSRSCAGFMSRHIYQILLWRHPWVIQCIYQSSRLYCSVV